jgi:hypothetical protein
MPCDSFGALGSLEQDHSLRTSWDPMWGPGPQLSLQGLVDLSLSLRVISF